MILNWYTGLSILIPVIFFIEILIAIRIYRKRRMRQQSGSPHNQSVLVVYNHNPPSSCHTVNLDQPHKITRLILTQSNASLNQGTWIRFMLGLCLGCVFILTFLLVNHLLRPYIYAWTLVLLPILFPIPFLVLPSLFDLKSFATFSYLLGGLSLGAVSLLLL